MPERFPRDTSGGDPEAFGRGTAIQRRLALLPLGRRNPLAELHASKSMATATLALTANYYLGNRRIYRVRKSAIDAIEKYFLARTQPATMASGLTA